MRFLALTSNIFKTIHHFLIWCVCYLFLFLLYKAYYLKSLMRFFAVSILKRGGNCHNLFLGYYLNLCFLFQKKIFELKKKSKKIIVVRKGCRSVMKMARIWLRRFKNTKIEIWQYFVDWWEPCWQRKFNLRKKSSKSDVYGLN